MVISTNYDEKYAPYIPFWRYCIYKAYPEYSVHAYKSFNPAIDRLLIDPIPSHFDCELKTVYHEYHYITDCDMMILQEPVSILDFHKKEMIEEGLCYSNSVRSNSEEQGESRVTGLHFVSMDWFKKTAEARGRYLYLTRKGNFQNRIDDELVLYKVIKESGLKLPSKKNLIDRHHGIHLGTIRANPNANTHEIFEQLRLRVTPEMAIKWQELVSCQDWEDMIKQAPEWLKNEMDIINKFTIKRAKQAC